MKIALLGNTCNNNFSFLRYLLDLGLDAHLFLYQNEGKPDCNPIHQPLWDTLDHTSIKGRIHYLEIPNSIESVIGRPDKLRLPPNLKSYRRVIGEFDICIGCGITPAVFKRIKHKLDIFHPYSTGIEWLYENENLKKLSRFNLEWPFRKYIFNLQLEGIREARRVVLPTLGLTKEYVVNNSINYVHLHVPQYYPEIITQSPETFLKELDQSTISLLTNRKTFKIFSFMRNLWVFDSTKYDHQTWMSLNKRNEILILGFAKSLKNTNYNDLRLFLSEWGPDVEFSKKLISNLEIQDNVTWLPVLPRIKVTYILNHYADLSVGEFVDSPGSWWGSTTWECLALGIPHLHTLNFTQNDFKEFFGCPLPPDILNVKGVDDIDRNILKTIDNYKIGQQRSLENKHWFQSYNGHELTKKWIKMFEEIISEKSRS